MNKEEILECNKLIIEFMDIKEIQSSYDNYGQQAPLWYASYLGYRTPAFSVPNKSIEHLLNESKFNNSWDWLMPCFNKLREYQCSYRISEEYCEIKSNIGQFNVECVYENTMEAAYNCIIKFIKWYNEQRRDSK